MSASDLLKEMISSLIFIINTTVEMQTVLNLETSVALIFLAFNHELKVICVYAV